MTEMKNFVTFDEHVVFGIPLIDSQHANLIRITNNLRLACHKNKEKANQRFINAIHEAADYVQYHFSTEEKLMSILEFPDYPEHKKEHGDFMWEVLSRNKQFREGDNQGPEKFVNFLSEWIHSHIKGADKIFADFFLNMKHHGKLRLTLSDVPQLKASAV